MKFLHNISLASKLTGIILSVTIFALLTGFTIYTLNAVSQFKNDFKNSMIVNANLIGEYSIGPILFDDRRGAAEILNKLKGIPEIQSAYIFDTTKAVFASYHPEDISPEPPAYKADVEVIFENNYLEIYQPIMLDDQQYGIIYINVSTNVLAKKINEQLYLIIGISIGILFLSWILATRIQSLISKPLLNLAEATKKVSQENDYSVRVTKKGNDEIGILYDQFNNMIQQIEARQKRQERDEAALRSSEAKYRNLFQNSLVGMYRTEVKTGKIIEANEVASKILNLPVDHKGSTIDLYANPLDREQITEIITKQGYIDNYEVQLKKGEDIIWVSISGQLFDEKKYFEGVIQDITEKKENFIKLKKANFELDSFVYHASHDLRSPLLSILGLVNLSEYEKDINEMHGFMGMIRKSITKLDNLISDLLVLSRDNRINDAIRQIDINKQIHECVENYDFLDNFSKIKINVEVDEKVPLVSDLTRVTIILNNLISNAIKYHRKDIKNPYIRVSANINNSKCKIIVEDNGEGIKEENLPQIFDMFYRATQKAEGSGLGLYIVKNVLDKLNGKITIDSEYAKGTRFTVVIPNQFKPEQSEVAV